MSSAVEEHVLYQIANAPVREYPFPHIFVENIFPADFYARLRNNWPASSELTSLPETGRVSKGAYAERFVLPFTPAGISNLQEDRRAFWSEVGEWLMAYRFLETVLNRFGSYVHKRFGDSIAECRYEADCLLVKDRSNYSIGPHTDAPHRLLSMLFYCPDDERLRHLGTSIYVPLERDFRCKGGPHHPHDRFRKVTTMEFKPNSLFAFVKTDNSFHGVEPIKDENIERDILLYDIRVFGPGQKKADHKQDLPQGGDRAGFNLIRRLLGHKS